MNNANLPNPDCLVNTQFAASIATQHWMGIAIMG